MSKIGYWAELERQGRAYGLREVPPGSKAAVRSKKLQRKLGASQRKSPGERPKRTWSVR